MLGSRVKGGTSAVCARGRVAGAATATKRKAEPAAAQRAARSEGLGGGEAWRSQDARWIRAGC